MDLEQLYKPFELKTRVGQGKQTFTYVESDDIVDRMNKVFKGRWCTEVIKSEIVEDQVLVLVRVWVKDPEDLDGPFYVHEGFASQLIGRYSYGDNKGKPIDLGNSFKSAMSKAIKTAVTKWGVGLYLEKSADEEVLPETTHVDVPMEAPVPPQPTLKSIPKKETIAPDFDDFPPFVGSGAPASVVQVALDPPKPQKIETPVPKPTVDDFDAPPIFTSEAVIKSNPKIENVPQNVSCQPTGGEEYLTDIQKIAIETIMKVHDLTFKDMSIKALGRTDNLPVSVDILTYGDAVKLIQYGNNLKKSGGSYGR